MNLMIMIRYSYIHTYTHITHITLLHTGEGILGGFESLVKILKVK